VSISINSIMGGECATCRLYLIQKKKENSMLKTVFVSSAICSVVLLLFLKLSWLKWIFLPVSIVCVISLIILNFNNFGYALHPKKGEGKKEVK